MRLKRTPGFLKNPSVDSGLALGGGGGGGGGAGHDDIQAASRTPRTTSKTNPPTVRSGL